MSGSRRTGPSSLSERARRFRGCATRSALAFAPSSECSTPITQRSPTRECCAGLSAGSCGPSARGATTCDATSSRWNCASWKSSSATSGRRPAAPRPIEGLMLEAYEAAAPDYDPQGQGYVWMRNVLWDRYARLFSAGQTVLDLGCGTGIDAVFLAQRGVRVMGIDASPSMIAQSRAKLAAAELDDLVDLRVMEVARLGTLPRQGFDGIICAFAALSTIAELDEGAASVARLLVPRGILVVHLLNRWSLWEWLGLVRS